MQCLKTLMAGDSVYKYRLLWVISALFIVQSYPKWFVYILDDFL